MTPIGDSKDGARCESLRVAERLTKPVKQSELFEAMARVLGIALPLTPEAASPDPRADRGERLDPSERTEIRLEPRRILLVEDSAANQKVALAMLAEHGHRVALARNGREAVERLGSEDFDLVLMDVQMPEMDGLAATTAIRAAEAGTPRHVPIIAMTAHALRGDREKCLAAGMDDYISKPVRRVELFRALARQIRPGPP